MSVNYDAYAVIGCEVPIGRLYAPVYIPHKDHEWPPDAKFCPVCGEITMATSWEPVFDEENNKLGEFDIIWSTDRKRAFIGWYAESEDVKMIELPNIEELRHKLAKTLAPLGSDLWNSDTFGLWSVLYCSY